MSATDQELHGRWVQKKDADAFSALVRAHGTMVYATCRRVLGDATEAEDLTQECFWKFARETRPVRSVGAWLHTVATRLCISKIRSEGRRQAREQKYSDNDPKSPAEPAWLEVIAWVDEAIARLPEDTRDVLVRHYFEGATHSSLAEELNVSPSTVTRRIQRGVERIREELSSKGMTVSVAALATGLAAEANAALPSSVQASLIKIGIGSVEKATSVTTTASSGSLVTSKAAWTTAIVLTVAAASWLLSRPTPAPTPDGSAPTSPGVIGGSMSVDSEQQTVASFSREASATVAAGETEVVQTSIAKAVALQVESSVTSSKEENGFTLTGTVYDLGWNPISGADVWAIGGTDMWAIKNPSIEADGFSALRHARTDSSGNYRIENVDPGQQTKVASSAEGFQGSVKFFEVSDVEEYKHDIHLEPGFSLRGRVLTLGGAPVSGAVVMVEAYALDTGYMDMSSDLFVTTDTHGRFRVGFEAGGFGTVSVAAEGHGRSYFVNVQISDGPEQEFLLKKPGAVSGRIVYDHGVPQPDLVVYVHGRFVQDRLPTDKGYKRNGITQLVGAEYENKTTADTDGRYRVTDLPSGLGYRFVVSTGTETLLETPELESLRPNEERVYDITLSSSFEVTGKVLGSKSGIGVKDIHIAIVLNEVRSFVANTTDDGIFRLTLRSPGRYLVYPSPYGQYAREELYAMGRWVDWQPGGTVDLTFYVPDPFSMGIQAVDIYGQPIEGAEIQLGRSKGALSRSAQGFGVGRTDAEGSFRYSFCSPGSQHTLTVEADGYTKSASSAINGEFGKSYPGEVIVLRRAGGLSGTLLFADRTPAAFVEAYVGVLAGGGQSTSNSHGPGPILVKIKTNGAGEFATDMQLPEGTLDLKFAAMENGRSADEAVVTGVNIAPGEHTYLRGVMLTPVDE